MWASADGGPPEVTLETSMGPFTVELYYKHAPRTCRNFLELSRRGYYDGVKFHRIIKDFIVQGGDPTGTGRGGESIYGKYFEDEIDARLKHTGAGILSMANAGPNTNGSQFFITLGPTPSLDEAIASLYRDKLTPNFARAVQLHYSNLSMGIFVRVNSSVFRGQTIDEWKHTIFGRVCKGMEIVKRLGSVQTDNTDRPIHDVKILKTTVKD